MFSSLQRPSTASNTPFTSAATQLAEVRRMLCEHHQELTPPSTGKFCIWWRRRSFFFSFYGYLVRHVCMYMLRIGDRELETELMNKNRFTTKIGQVCVSLFVVELSIATNFH